MISVEKKIKQRILTLLMKIHFWRNHRILIFKPESNRKRTKKIQHYLKDAYEKYGYSGFSIEVDDAYTDSSFYFLAENMAQEVVAVLRATHKKKQKKLPIEMAIRFNNGKNYSFENDKRIMEINSFAYSNIYLTPILYRALANHTIHHGINRIILLADVHSKRNLNLYEASGFKISASLKDQVYFESFKYKVSQTPALWNVMESDVESMKHLWGERRREARLDMRIEAELYDELAQNPVQCLLVNLSKKGAKLFTNDRLVINIQKGTLKFSGNEKRISEFVTMLLVRKLRKRNPDLEYEGFIFSVHILFDKPLNEIYYF